VKPASNRDYWINRPNLIVLSASLIAILVLGPRSTLGLFTDPISLTNGWGRDVVALAIGIQHLVWGLLQPAAGALADRYGCRRIIVIGACGYALGLALIPFSITPQSLYLTAGLLVGISLSGVGFPVVVAALGRLVPAARRSAALGIATAAGSVGQFLFAPIGQGFIANYGWPVALWCMAATVLTVIVLAVPFAADSQRPNADVEPPLSLKAAVYAAFGHRSYVLLVSGFFVCGFHVSFIMAHFPPYLSDIGISSSLAAWALSLIGLFNIFGAFSAGIFGGRYSKRILLSAIYAARAIAMAVFLVSGKSGTAVLLFAATLGLLWLSTVPLTSGLVAVMFGTRYLGTLFGFVFMAHQLGAFVGVWLGGYLYERTGSYDSMWVLAVGLSVVATFLHWPLDERRASQFAGPAFG
jgi:MFS family permease